MLPLAKLRQEIDGPPGQRAGLHSLLTDTPIRVGRTIKGGGEALPRYDIKDHIFFILKSGDFPNYTWAEKFLGGLKRRVRHPIENDVNYP